MIGRLERKVLLILGAVVGLAMVVLVVGTHAAQREQLTTSALQVEGRVLDATYAGLVRPMEVGDGAAVGLHLREVAEAMPGVEIHVLAPDLAISYSSAPEAVGQRLADRVQDDGLLRLVETSLGPEAREAQVPVSTRPPAVLRPIRNAAQCHHCHGASRPVLGALLVRHTHDVIGEQLSSSLGHILVYSLVLALGVIGFVFLLLRQLVMRPLAEIGRAASAISGGDLTRSAVVQTALPRALQALGNDEIADLGAGFEAMTTHLRGVLKELQESTGALDREAAGLLASASGQASMAAEQSSAAHETAAVVAQIAQTSRLSSEHAATVTSVCDRSEEIARAGQQAVAEALRGLDTLAARVQAIAGSITGLAEQTQRIGLLVASLEEVADQCNLLALNAAIEASRAGESGRGFAVVAAEVRKLARQAKTSAGQARQLLIQVLGTTRSAVAETEAGSTCAAEAAVLAKAAGDSITGMTDAMRESSTAAKQIATYARQQTEGLEQVVSGVTLLSDVSGESARSARQLESVASGLGDVSKKLSELVGRFKA